MGSKARPKIRERGGSYVVVYPKGTEVRCYNLSTAKYYIKEWERRGYIPPN